MRDELGEEDLGGRSVVEDYGCAEGGDEGVGGGGGGRDDGVGGGEVLGGEGAEARGAAVEEDFF